MLSSNLDVKYTDRGISSLELTISPSRSKLASLVIEEELVIEVKHPKPACGSLMHTKSNHMDSSMSLLPFKVTVAALFWLRGMEVMLQ
jgi:hypothetical protein